FTGDLERGRAETLAVLGYAGLAEKGLHQDRIALFRAHEQGSRPNPCFARRTRKAASLTRIRNAGSAAALDRTASTIAWVASAVFETTRSPPAERNIRARLPAGMLATATVAPRSSETITPWKPKVPRSICPITIGEKAARCDESMRVKVAIA